MADTKADSAHQVDIAGRRLIDAFGRPATPLFVGLTIGLGWLLWFPLTHVDYTDFLLVCNHDPAAALRTDEIVSMGQRPGVDFFYYYGPLPILLCRAFFAVFGRSPLALLALIAVVGAGFTAGLVSIVQSFKPTRLGVLLVAVASLHTITILVPTHSLEAALLVWTVAMRIRGHGSAALALAVCGIFTKISMGSVLLLGLVALTVIDAVRARSSRPLASLLAVPGALLVLFVACSLVLGPESVIACFDPRVGARLYSAANLGFLREGRYLWHPAGHTLGWYFGGVPGPWIAASTVLLALAPSAALRFVRGAVRGTARDAKALADELLVIACIANLAFVVVFFGPGMQVSYYAWLPLVGVTPLLAKAHWGPARVNGSPWYGWLALTAFLVMSTKSTIVNSVRFLRQPRTWVGDTSMRVDEADDLKESLALAHATGRGVVTVVARAANFGLVDPTLRQGGYWMMQAGMPTSPSIAELLNLAHSSDALFVSRFDYPGLLKIPEFQPLLTKSELLHDGTHFVVLRPPTTPLP